MVQAEVVEIPDRNWMGRYLLLSAVVHTVLILTLAFEHDWIRSPVLSRPLEIELVPSPKAVRNPVRNQVVATSLADRSKASAKDAFLGQNTQTVLKQTKAAKIASFSEGRVGSSEKAARSKPRVKLSDLGLGFAARAAEPSSGAPGTMASNNDALNVPEGSQTLLNTQEYAYYSFYQRVKRQVEQFWEPGLRQRLVALSEQGRTIASTTDYETGLTVLIDSRGAITQIIVNDPSGVREIDQVAIESFNRIGVVPNPPRGLADHDGIVRIQWKFVVRT